MDQLIKSRMGKHFIRAQIRSNQLLRRKSAHITQVVTMICREKSVHSWLFQCRVIKFLIALITDSPHLHHVCDVRFTPKSGHSGDCYSGGVLSAMTLQHCKLALPSFKGIHGTSNSLIARASIFQGHNQVERGKSHLLSRTTYWRLR